MMMKLIQLFVFISLSIIASTIYANYPPNYPVIPQEIINVRAKIKQPKPQPALPVIPLSKTNQFKIFEPKFINISSHRETQPLTRYTVFPGSLKWNVTHIAHHFGWNTVIWLPHYDFRWIGNRMIISGKSVQTLMRKLLADYPLQAVFYMGNHVLVITPRTLR